MRFLSAHLLILFVSEAEGCCFFRKFPSDPSALLFADLYYTRLSLCGVSEHLSHNALLELYQMLHANLSSNVSKVGVSETNPNVRHFGVNEVSPDVDPPPDSEDLLSV